MAISIQSILNQIAQNQARAAAASASLAAQLAARAQGFSGQQQQRIGQQVGGRAFEESLGATNPIIVAVQVIKQAITHIVDQADKMKEAILTTTAAYKPFQVEQFTRRMKDLQAVFGVIFLPVLLEFGNVLRSVADYLYSLPQGFRNVVRTIGAIGLVVSVFAALTTAAAGIAAVFGILLSGIGTIVSTIAALTYAFAQTSGGIKFFKNALGFVEGIFAAIYQKAQQVWSFIQPLISLIGGIFSILGEALSSIVDEIRPLVELLLEIGKYMGGAFIIVIGAAVAALALLVAAIIRFVTWPLYVIKKLSQALGFKGVEDVKREQKSAFGLAAQGGNITSDVSSVKTRLEETILANTGREADRPEKQTAKNTAQLVTDVGDIKNTLKSKKDDKSKDTSRLEPKSAEYSKATHRAWGYQFGD